MDNLPPLNELPDDYYNNMPQGIPNDMPMNDMADDYYGNYGSDNLPNQTTPNNQQLRDDMPDQNPTPTTQELADAQAIEAQVNAAAQAATANAAPTTNATLTATQQSYDDARIAANTAVQELSDSDFVAAEKSFYVNTATVPTQNEILYPRIKTSPDFASKDETIAYARTNQERINLSDANGHNIRAFDILAAELKENKFFNNKDNKVDGAAIINHLEAVDKGLQTANVTTELQSVILSENLESMTRQQISTAYSDKPIIEPAFQKAASNAFAEITKNTLDRSAFGTPYIEKEDAPFLNKGFTKAQEDSLHEALSGVSENTRQLAYKDIHSQSNLKGFDYNTAIVTARTMLNAADDFSQRSNQKPAGAPALLDNFNDRLLKFAGDYNDQPNTADKIELPTFDPKRRHANTDIVDKFFPSTKNPPSLNILVNAFHGQAQAPTNASASAMNAMNNIPPASQQDINDANDAIASAMQDDMDDLGSMDDYYNNTNQQYGNPASTPSPAPVNAAPAVTLTAANTVATNSDEPDTKEVDLLIGIIQKDTFLTGANGSSGDINRINSSLLTVNQALDDMGIENKLRVAVLHENLSKSAFDIVKADSKNQNDQVRSSVNSFSNAALNNAATTHYNNSDSTDNFYTSSSAPYKAFELDTSESAVLDKALYRMSHGARQFAYSELKEAIDKDPTLKFNDAVNIIGKSLNEIDAVHDKISPNNDKKLLNGFTENLGKIVNEVNKKDNATVTIPTEVLALSTSDATVAKNLAISPAVNGVDGDAKVNTDEQAKTVSANPTITTPSLVYDKDDPRHPDHPNHIPPNQQLSGGGGGRGLTLFNFNSAPKNGHKSNDFPIVPPQKIVHLGNNQSGVGENKPVPTAAAGASAAVTAAAVVGADVDFQDALANTRYEALRKDHAELQAKYNDPTAKPNKLYADTEAFLENIKELHRQTEDLIATNSDNEEKLNSYDRGYAEITKIKNDIEQQAEAKGLFADDHPINQKKEKEGKTKLQDTFNELTNSLQGAMDGIKGFFSALKRAATRGTPAP